MRLKKLVFCIIDSRIFNTCVVGICLALCIIHKKNHYSTLPSKSKPRRHHVQARSSAEEQYWLNKSNFLFEELSFQIVAINLYGLQSEAPLSRHKPCNETQRGFRVTPRTSFPGFPHIHTHYTCLVFLALPQGVGELLQGASDQFRILPQAGGQEAVGVGDGDESGLEGVLEGLGGTGGRGIGVLDTGKLEESLDSGGGNEASTTGGRDKLF